MISPKQMTQLFQQCQNEFKVQTIFATGQGGQMLAQIGQTIQQLPQFSTLSIFVDDCQDIGRIQLAPDIKLNYVFVEINDLQIVMSTYKNLFTLGIASQSQNIGMLVMYMNKLHEYLNQQIK